MFLHNAEENNNELKNFFFDFSIDQNKLLFANKGSYFPQNLVTIMRFNVKVSNL